MIAITASTLFTPLERIAPPLLLMDEGAIVEVTSRARREIQKMLAWWILPTAYWRPDLLTSIFMGVARCDGWRRRAAASGAPLASHGVSSYFDHGHGAAGCDPFRLARLGARSKLRSGSTTTKRQTTGAAGDYLEGPFISHAARSASAGKPAGAVSGGV
jgi:hypothetical protein